MSCISPPELDAFQLLAHLDGASEPKVGAHLEDCAHCRARAARLQRMEALLTAAAYRRSCPSPDDLGEYLLGLQGRKQAAGISQHLRECKHCAHELAQLQLFLGDLAPSPEPSPLEEAIEQVRVVVARLISGASGQFLALQPAPAMAGLRGEEPAARVFAAEDAQIIVGVQPAAEAPDRLVLLGLITGVDPAGYSVHVWQGGRLIASVPVDEVGNFIVSDLAPGGHELVLSGAVQEIYIEELPI
jgi:hypothetical protein